MRFSAEIFLSNWVLIDEWGINYNITVNIRNLHETVGLLVDKLVKNIDCSKMIFFFLIILQTVCK